MAQGFLRSSSGCCTPRQPSAFPHGLTGLGHFVPSTKASGQPTTSNPSASRRTWTHVYKPKPRPHGRRCSRTGMGGWKTEEQSHGMNGLRRGTGLACGRHFMLAVGLYPTKTQVLRVSFMIVFRMSFRFPRHSQEVATALSGMWPSIVCPRRDPLGIFAALPILQAPFRRQAARA